MDTEKKIPVVLAGKDFVVKQIPMARAKRVGTTLSEVFKDFDTAQLKSDAGVVAFLDRLLQTPHAILSIFIDNLPVEIFTDEENGVTLPEFLDVLHKAVELNRIDTLKNGFTRLIPTLTQASGLVKTN